MENPSNKILVCLAGVGTATTVVSLIIEDVNQTVSSPVPTFAELAKCESKETFFYLRKPAKIKFKSKRITPVPQLFIETIAQRLYVSSDPSAILLALLPSTSSSPLPQNKTSPTLVCTPITSSGSYGLLPVVTLNYMCGVLYLCIHSSTISSTFVLSASFLTAHHSRQTSTTALSQQHLG